MLESEALKGWLAEDIGRGDVTTEALILSDQNCSVRILAKADGIACGLSTLSQVCSALGNEVKTLECVNDGTPLQTGQVAARFEGSQAVLLQAERTYLNLIQHLCGIATLTSHYVKAVSHTRAKILDTRKTLPGLRLLAKAAVVAGGGHNHRIGLHDAFLIKENHLTPFRHLPNPFLSALEGARRLDPNLPLIIEVENLEEMNLALEGMPDVILLDNMSLDDMAKAVETVEAQPGTELEASGGINLDTVVGVAETGVHRISVGAITHSALPLDLSLLVDGSDQGRSLNSRLPDLDP